MTTIAYDRITLAADTQVTQGGVVLGYENKIAILPDGSRLAGGGDSESCFLAEEWFSKGCIDSERPKLETYRAIFFPANGGEPLEFNEGLIGMKVFTPWAMGSGGRWALAAMLLGKGAHEAVEFACRIDLFSGGDITEFCPAVYTVKEWQS